MRADTLPPEVERELSAIDDALAGRPVDPDLAELALLVRDVRDEKPLIDPSFAHDLDERMAAGFPREPGRFARLLATRPSWPAPLAFAATALVVVGVSLAVVDGSGGPDDPVSGQSGGGSVAAPELSDRGGGGGDTGASTDAMRSTVPGSTVDDAAGTVMPVPPPPGRGSPRSDRRRDRKVERSASLTLVAPPDRITHVADRIVRVADSLGGFVVTSTVGSGEGGSGHGTFELRVPSARLQQALADLSRLAHVRERQQATQDITAESVSARERLADARAERASLLRRLARALTEAQADAIRAQLRDVSLRIRTARADLARVSNRAAFSTVLVVLEADPDATEESDDGVWSPGDALDDALRVLEVVVGVALVALAVLLPLALLGGLGLLGRRAVLRRRRERALDAA